MMTFYVTKLPCKNLSYNVKVFFTNKIQKIDNQPPVLFLGVRLWSEDLKHLIPKPENPDYRVSIHNLLYTLNESLYPKWYRQNPSWGLTSCRLPAVPSPDSAKSFRGCVTAKFLFRNLFWFRNLPTHRRRRLETLATSREDCRTNSPLKLKIWIN